MAYKKVLTIYENIKETGRLPYLEKYPEPLDNSNVEQFINLVLVNNDKLMATQKYLLECKEYLEGYVEDLQKFTLRLWEKKKCLEKEADMLATFCAVLCPNVPYYINCQSCDNCPGGVDCKDADKPEAWRKAAQEAVKKND